MLQLIPNWRDAWRMTSVNLPAIGLAVLGILEVIPDAILSIWAVLPADVRATIPPDVIRYAGYAIIAAGAISRIVRQPRLAERRAIQEGNRPERDEGATVV